MNNQECTTRTKIINNNNNEPVIYPFSIKVNKCCGSCKNINNLYAKLCVPDVAKNINVKVFNLMPWSNQAKHIEYHKTFKCKYRSNSSVCNNKQRWNEDKCRCECRELVDKKRCDNAFIWNPSNCNCECDKSCDIGEYLDHKNCKCKKMIDQLVEKCSENIDENKMIYDRTLNDYKSSSCELYIIIFVVFLVTNIVLLPVFLFTFVGI